MIELINLCHGYLSVPMCLSWLSYRGLLSSQVVHWRANAGLLLSYPTICNITSIILIYLYTNPPLQQHNNNNINYRDFMHKKLKLDSPISLRNMHAFDDRGRIVKYETPESICEKHYEIRLHGYVC